MGVFEEYQSVSFRGVPFLVPSESEDTGQKSVVHEYPNSDRRFVEQLGRIPSTFKMDAIIHGPDAIQQRINLIEALSKPGIGELVHPIYGTLNVKALPFSVRSSQTRMGEFIFTLEFAKTQENITPTPETATPQSVTQASLTAVAAVDNALESNYIQPETGSLLTASAENVISTSRSVNSEISSVTDVDSEALSTFKRASDAVTNTAYKLAQSPVDLVSSLSAMYRTALQIVDTPSRLSDAWRKLLDNVEEITAPTDTVKRANKVTNNNLLDEHNRLNILINFYESESYRDYTTATELEDAIALLDSKYDEYINYAVEVAKDSGIVSIVTDAAVRNAFNALRNVAAENFKSKAQNLWRVVSISPGRSSMSLTAYKYYGNLDNFDLLKDLNPGINVATFNESDISAVTK